MTADVATIDIEAMRLQVDKGTTLQPRRFLPGLVCAARAREPCSASLASAPLRASQVAQMPTTEVVAASCTAAALASTRAAPREDVAAASAAPLPCDVPRDVLPLIFRHLNGWQLSRCVSVCKSWHALLCGTEEYWRAALAADFVDGEHAYARAKTGTLANPRHLARFRRVAPALRSGAYKYALVGLQAMRRERDTHVQRRLRDEADADFEESVQLEATMAVVGAAAVRTMQNSAHAPGAALEVTIEAAEVAEFVNIVTQAAARDRHAAQLDPRRWAMVAPRERVTWYHRLRGEADELGRAGLAPANAALRSWWLTLTRPYEMVWVDADVRETSVQHQPRRICLPLLLCNEGAHAAYLLYQTLAANLLRGRCRCCNRVTANMHAQLRVPMCATRQCAGAYPIRPRKAEAEAAAALPRRHRPAWRPRNADKRK